MSHLNSFEHMMTWIRVGLQWYIHQSRLGLATAITMLKTRSCSEKKDHEIIHLKKQNELLTNYYKAAAVAEESYRSWNYSAESILEVEVRLPQPR